MKKISFLIVVFFVALTACTYGQVQDTGSDKTKKVEKQEVKKTTVETIEKTPTKMKKKAVKKAAKKVAKKPAPKKSPKQLKRINDFADAAVDYINTKAEENDGYYVMKDEETGKTLHLKLIKVHREHLYKQRGGYYCGCADFKAKDGTLYDLDFNMKRDASGKFVMSSEPVVHKVNGEPRYTWYKDHGTWHKDPTGKYKGNEHPAH